MFDNLRQQYRNARTCIAQIRRGEWHPIYSEWMGEHLHAERYELDLDIANGPFFCEIEEPSAPYALHGETYRHYFGPIFRHWVWWAAVRELKRDADAMRPKAPSLDGAES